MIDWSINPSLKDATKRGVAIHRAVARGVEKVVGNHAGVVGRVGFNGTTMLYVSVTPYYYDQYRLMIEIPYGIARNAAEEGLSGRNSIWFGLGLAIGNLYLNRDVYNEGHCPLCGMAVGHKVLIDTFFGDFCAYYMQYRCLEMEVFKSPVSMGKEHGHEPPAPCRFNEKIPDFGKVALDRLFLEKPHKGKVDPRAVRTMNLWRIHGLAVGGAALQARLSDER